MPGAIPTNFARNFDPAFVAGFVQAAGAQVEVKRGERLPDGTRGLSDGQNRGTAWQYARKVSA